MTTTVQTLTAARALIEPPGSWCQKLSAVDDRGIVALDWQKAHARCGLGAIWTIRDIGTKDVAVAESILAQVARDRGYDNFPKFNDDPATTHAMVLDAFTVAIEKAKSE